MIIDTLENHKRYTGTHAGFLRAFQFLEEIAKRPFVVGRQELWGDRLIAIVEEGIGRTRENCRLENHKRYIDIQYVADGVEEMGWKAYNECKIISQPYTAERDIEFFADKPDTWLTLPKQSFAIFFPEEDAHAPLAGTSTVQKIIMKVAI